MKTIIVLSRQYYDGSGYSVLKAYTKERAEEAKVDKEMNEEFSSSHVYRLTEIPISE
jgi:hypothetical protein